MNEIYCLSTPDGICKIGFTSGLKFRKRDLERRCGQPLTVVFAIAVPRSVRADVVEKSALISLRPHLVRGREWFRASADTIRAAVVKAMEDAIAAESEGLKRLK